MATAANGSLAEVLARLRAASHRVVELTGSELATWPAADVVALQAAGVLLPGTPARSAVCPGCEEACAMAVEQWPRAGREPLLFIVCDRRDDVAQVPVPPAALERWRATEAGLADAVARLLGAEAATPSDGTAARYRLGVVKGRQGRDTAYLGWQEAGPVLLLAGHVLDLEMVLDLRDGRLVIDAARLRRCVDAPTGAPDIQELPADRQRRLLAAVESERRRNPRKFLGTVAEREGISVYALKQVIYRKPVPKPANAMADMAKHLAPPVLPNRKPKP